MGKITYYLRKLAFETNSLSNSLFYDLDNLIKQKDNFINYINSEYTVALIYNLMMSISTLFYLNNNINQLMVTETIISLWLLLVSSIKVVEILPKTIILLQTIRIKYNSNDSIVCCRRLMNITRSNIFLLNSFLGYALTVAYSFFVLVINRMSCIKNIQLSYVVNILVLGFFFRLIISFFTYYFHFKYGINQADLHNMEMLMETHNGSFNKELLNQIETHKLNSENFKEICKDEECVICLNKFSIDDTVKVLTCKTKHVFHGNCIEKWLENNKACPTCRNEDFLTK